MKDGAVFCHECGAKTEPIAQAPVYQAPPPPQPAYQAAPQPVYQAPPQPVYQAPPPPQPVYQAPPQPVYQAPPQQPQPNFGGSINFEVVNKEFIRLLRVDVVNSAFRYESGAMYYMLGDLMIEANLPSAGGFLKSMVTKEAAVKPVIKGNGTVFLEPTFGEFTILELNNEEWILDKGAYYASEMNIEVGMFTNKSLQGFFSGEGFFQTKVSGTGKVVIVSSGPIEEVVLNNNKLVVDGSFAVARTAGVQLQVARASKGLFSSFASGEGIVNTFTGQGKVLISPVYNRYVSLMNYLGTINSNVLAVKKSG
jgi:uncharacterized protein (AIM24 family)